jgi:hypothetical protein
VQRGLDTGIIRQGDPGLDKVAACAICGSGSVRTSEDGYHELSVVGRIKLDDRGWMGDEMR